MVIEAASYLLHIMVNLAANHFLLRRSILDEESLISATLPDNIFNYRLGVLDVDS